MDADLRPIYLPTKRVTLNGGDSVIQFVIDKNIGKDTEFTFTSEGIDHLTYASSSPEYTYHAAELQKIFRIPLAEIGKWDLVVSNTLRLRRQIRSTSEAIITVKSHQLDETIPPIRLDATLSKRTLEYPKSTELWDMEASRIVIYAELRRGQYPIINASVFGHLQGLNEETITFQLDDDGSFPDELANDGVYTASIIKLKQVERYSVHVTATNSNDTAKLLSEEIDYFERKPIDCNSYSKCEFLSDFERETYLGSIKLISTDNVDNVPLNPITDLRATILNETERVVALEWTSPADEVFDLHVKEYDIRTLLVGHQGFESAFRFNDSHIVEQSHAGERKERYLVHVPAQFWKYDKKLDEPGFFLELKFVVRAIGANDAISPMSNTAAVIVKDKPVVLLNAHKLCRAVRKQVPRIGEITVTYC